MQTYKGNLDDFIFMRRMLESQFARSKEFYSWLLLAYGFSMVLFTVQLHWATGTAAFILNTI